mgnify:CR=1 FL=1
MPVADSARAQRVLLFIHSLHGGGAERVAADLSAHWADMGREVMVVTQAGTEGDVYTPVSYTHLTLPTILLV